MWLSAAATCRSVALSFGAPARSMALTSMCEASHGAISAVRPVSTFTTPPGTSEVASTSVSVTAGRGRASDAITTAALPDTMIGARRLTRPSRLEDSGAMRPTTPVGSGTLKLK